MQLPWFKNKNILFCLLTLPFLFTSFSNLFAFWLPQSQFGLIILYLWLLYYNDCDVSQPFNLIWIINVCVIAGFFVNFYIRTYVLNPRKLTSSHSNKEKSTWPLSCFSSYLFIWMYLCIYFAIRNRLWSTFHCCLLFLVKEEI